MAGMANSNDHPVADAVHQQHNYIPLTSSSRARRQRPLRSTPAEATSTTAPEPGHYHALLSGFADPSELRQAVGRY